MLLVNEISKHISHRYRYAIPYRYRDEPLSEMLRFATIRRAIQTGH